MCVYVFVCACVSMPVCVFVSIFVCMCLFVSIFVCMCVFVSICVCVCVSLYVRLSLGMCVCVSMCVDEVMNESFSRVCVINPDRVLIQRDDHRQDGMLLKKHFDALCE